MDSTCFPGEFAELTDITDEKLFVAPHLREKMEILDLQTLNDQLGSQLSSEVLFEIG